MESAKGLELEVEPDGVEWLEEGLEAKGLEPGLEKKSPKGSMAMAADEDSSS